MTMMIRETIKEKTERGGETKDDRGKGVDSMEGHRELGERREKLFGKSAEKAPLRPLEYLGRG